MSFKFFTRFSNICKQVKNLWNNFSVIENNTERTGKYGTRFKLKNQKKFSSLEIMPVQNKIPWYIRPAFLATVWSGMCLTNDYFRWKNKDSNLMAPSRVCFMYNIHCKHFRNCTECVQIIFVSYDISKNIFKRSFCSSFKIIFVLFQSIYDYKIKTGDSKILK